MGLSRNSKPAILIVDDARDYAEMIAEVIGESFTRQIYLASDANEALALVTEVHQKGEFAIDAVISDIHMPGMSGHDFLMQLVSHGVYAPVIFVSGLAELNLAIHALRLSAFDYLTKPINPEQLIESARLASGKGHRIREILLALSEIQQHNSGSGASAEEKKAINHLLEEIQKNLRMSYLLGLKNSNVSTQK
jgi:two-component system nitrogen regulation response regulator NtrX